MKITQIRSATNRLVYAGKTFLIDPWLAPRHSFSFVDIPGRPYHIPDPMKEHLPLPMRSCRMSTISSSRISIPITSTCPSQTVQSAPR